MLRACAAQCAACTPESAQAPATMASVEGATSSAVATGTDSLADSAAIFPPPRYCMHKFVDMADCVVIGAGVVGLAVARALLRAGRSCVVLEAAAGAGTGTSSRSSSVVHAGIYYPRRSLKAELCVRGRRLLYEYAQANGVRFLRRGKLIVATSREQVAGLSAVRAMAESNGVDDVRALTGAEAMALEPALQCEAALWSPSTGVIDSFGLLQTLEQEVASLGGTLVFNHACKAARWRAADNKFDVDVAVPSGSDVLECGALVNCAGLSAVAVAKSLVTGVPAHDGAVPGAAYYAKGSYFRLRRPSPFERLVYPLPEAHGLGVHLTVDVDGVARFGPDVEWVLAPNYDVDEAKAPAFAQVIAKYFPGLPDASALAADYAGVRPKLGPAAEAARDFVLWGPAQHGVHGLVHCLGVESPGLTSSLALGELVAGVATAGVFKS